MFIQYMNCIRLFSLHDDELVKIVKSYLTKILIQFIAFLILCAVCL